MSTYGWVLIASAFFPIIFSFHPKINFYKKWGKVFLSGLIIAVPFWVWDSMATSRGDWSFNQKYVGEMKIAGMPIEEVIFFLIIPFCCLFISYLINKYVKDKKIKINKRILILITVLITILALMVRDKYYTSTILWWSVITMVISQWLDRDLFGQLNYWKWIGITFIPFLVVNGVLTYLPVVEYSNQAILGIRMVSIPIEDFLYSWSLLTLNLVIYRKLDNDTND